MPALGLDDGEVLTENAVILQYLAERARRRISRFQRAASRRYHFLEWLNFIATELHKGFGPLWNPAHTGRVQAGDARVCSARSSTISRSRSATGPICSASASRSSTLMPSRSSTGASMHQIDLVSLARPPRLSRPGGRAASGPGDAPCRGPDQAACLPVAKRAAALRRRGAEAGGLRTKPLPHMGGAPIFDSDEEQNHDRHPPFATPRPCRPWLAQRPPPFLLRRLSRSGPHGLGRDPGVERRRDRRPLRLPAASAPRHGDHHLCPRGRDHPPGFDGQQGPHRGRRRPGDVGRHRRAPRRI